MMRVRVPISPQLYSCMYNCFALCAPSVYKINKNFFHMNISAFDESVQVNYTYYTYYLRSWLASYGFVLPVMLGCGFLCENMCE